MNFNPYKVIRKKYNNPKKLSNKSLIFKEQIMPEKRRLFHLTRSRRDPSGALKLELNQASKRVKIALHNSVS
jgi:hypothetical protein